jgi:hypothetical protein
MPKYLYKPCSYFLSISQKQKARKDLGPQKQVIRKSGLRKMKYINIFSIPPSPMPQPYTDFQAFGPTVQMLLMITL